MNKKSSSGTNGAKLSSDERSDTPLLISPEYVEDEDQYNDFEL